MSEIGFSYLRYSSLPQGEGDSIRRQTAGARAWCERNGVQFDTATTMEDQGKSAFRGKHRETGVLAAFLADVEAGRIPRGSYLIVENLDRLSRENPWDAVPLLCSIVNAGISVVTLSPSEMVYKRGRDMTPLVLAVVEFGRGHSESATKSDRVTEAWDERKRLAREGQAIVTRRLPAWVEERDGKLVLVPERARVVRLIFDLTTKGYGQSLIVKKLTEDNVPCFGRASGWSKAYLHKIITGRAVLGEYQPFKTKKTDGPKVKEPDGPPVANYYPAVIDQGTWDRAQIALESRKKKTGRVGHRVASLFTGLLWDAATQTRLGIAWQGTGRKQYRTSRRVLMSAAGMDGRAPIVTFPYAVFEEAVLKLLSEIDPADVIGEEPRGEAAALADELAAVQRRRAQVEAELAESGDDIPALVRVLRTIDAKEQELLKRLASARRAEANPRGAAWQEMKTLLDVAADEAGRLRLRGVLAHVIESAWVLIVPIDPHHGHRLCAAQFRFAGSEETRDYLISYHAGTRARGGTYGVNSMKFGRDAGGLDLRKRTDAKALTKLLAALGPDAPIGNRPCPAPKTREQ
jgi:DNA invertase Pin-like site-specific DNA recombinase